MAFHDPTHISKKVRDGIERMLRSRICASTPAQYGYLAGLNGNDDWMAGYLEMIKERNDFCVKRINNIEGLSVENPQGAFYMFIKLVDPYWNANDKEFVLKLLNQKYVLAVHGSGFSKNYGKGHFRIVFLPKKEILNEAMNRIEELLIESPH